MRTLIAAAAGSLFLATTAMAQPTGEISINGSDVYDPTTITFENPANVGGSGGSFTALADCDNCVTMIADLTAGEASGTLFTATSTGHTASLDLTSPAMFDFMSNPVPSLDALEVTGSGNLSLDGDSTPGSYVLTAQGPADGASHVTFSATATPSQVTVPAPAIGSGMGALAVLGLLLVACRKDLAHWLAG